MAKISVLWPYTAGYVTAGLAELARRGHEVTFVSESESHYDSALIGADGIRHVRIRGAGNQPRSLLDVDLSLICGWHRPAINALAKAVDRRRTVKVLYFDTQWSGRPKQQIGRVAGPWMLRRNFDYCFVPGDRQALFAHKIGFNSDQIVWGSLTFSPVFATVQPINNGNALSRQQILFVGRLANEKGVETLLRAYEMYRRDAANPWRLNVAGAGQLPRPLEGVTILGHLQEKQLAQIMEESSLFVLPSLKEPFGVAILEAAAAGLPVVTTYKAGAVSQVVDPGVSGLLTVPGDPTSLSRAMKSLTDRSPAELGRMGEIGRDLASRHDADRWATAVESMLRSDS